MNNNLLTHLLHFNKIKFFSLSNSFIFFNKYGIYSHFIYINKFVSNQNIINNKELIYLFKSSSKYFYNLNKTNIYLFKNVSNVLMSLFSNKSNLIFFDSNYKLILPFYNYVFGTKSLYTNKDFFFAKKEMLTKNNWSYYFIRNLQKFNVNLIVIFDYFYFKKFLTIFKKFNKPILSLIPEKIKNVYIDYYLYINKINLDLSNFFLFNFITNLYFNLSNLFFFFNKHRYLVKFNKIFNINK